MTLREGAFLLMRRGQARRRLEEGVVDDDRPTRTPSRRGPAGPSDRPVEEEERLRRPPAGLPAGERLPGNRVDRHRGGQPASLDDGPDELATGVDLAPFPGSRGGHAARRRTSAGKAARKRIRSTGGRHQAKVTSVALARRSPSARSSPARPATASSGSSSSDRSGRSEQVGQARASGEKVPLPQCPPAPCHPLPPRLVHGEFPLFDLRFWAGIAGVTLGRWSGGGLATSGWWRRG